MLLNVIFPQQFLNSHCFPSNALLISEQDTKTSYGDKTLNLYTHTKTNTAL